MTWKFANRAHVPSRKIADRHYNRQKIGTDQFVPPGRCIVLYAETDTGKAMWTSSWPFAEFTKHQWAGAWINSSFRNEGAGLSSDLIREAVAITRGIWDVPSLGMITFIDRSKVRKKRDFGRCYLRAGFSCCGETKGGLLALQLLPQNMPEPISLLESAQP